MLKYLKYNEWARLKRRLGNFAFDNNLTGNAYEVFMGNELLGLLENIPLIIRSQMYFQNDGTPPHFTRYLREYLNETFCNSWLGLCGRVAWPLKSPDLTLLDYYIWGHMKTLVYETKFDSRAPLRHCIFQWQNTTVLTTTCLLLSTYWCVPQTSWQLDEGTLNNYCKAGTVF